jgi:hypothetical protein
MARPNTEFFIYPINFLLLAVAEVRPVVLTIDATSEFVWYYGAYAADANGAIQTAATRVYPLVDIMITPTDTTAQMSQAPVPVTSMFGIGENPFVLPAPRLFPARTSITFTATNRDAANTNLRLQLIGVKRFLG